MVRDAEIMAEFGNAFRHLIHAPAFRPYGTPRSQYQGVSDSNQGVQWNAGIDRVRDVLTLGVNLEGMQYDGWPLARLIERELSWPQLPKLATSTAAGGCELWFSRDAWQAAARLPIEEQWLTAEAPLALGSLDSPLWRSVLQKAYDCLDPRKGYRARRKQKVTLSSSGAIVEKWVSPHLQIKTLLPVGTAASGADIMAALKDAHETLKPIHQWMVERSRP